MLKRVTVLECTIHKNVVSQNLYSMGAFMNYVKPNQHMWNHPCVTLCHEMTPSPVTPFPKNANPIPPWVCDIICECCLCETKILLLAVNHIL